MKADILLSMLVGMSHWTVFYVAVLTLFWGIRPAKKTSFEGVGTGWIRRGQLSFSDVWVKGWFGRGKKKDITVKMEKKHNAVSIVVESDSSGTLLSFTPNVRTILGFGSSARKVIIHVSSVEEKEAWEEYIAKKIQEFNLEKERAKTHVPRKVLPGA